MSKRKNDETPPGDHAELGGSNGGPKIDDRKAKAGPVAADALKKYVERIERLEEEKRALGADIKEIYVEAKSNGFEPKIMRKIVALRRQKAADREEEEALLEVYKQAIGL